MEQMRITVRTAAEKPNYKKTAAELLEACRLFYQDQENEMAYQEWKEKRNDTSQLIQRNRRTGSCSGDGGFQNRRAV